MGEQDLPEWFEIDRISFQDCFTAPSLRYLLVFMTSWALTVGARTISQVILARVMVAKNATVKPQRRSYKPKPEPVLELIERTRSWVAPETTLRVIVDGGYSNSTMVKNCPAGVHLFR